MISFSDLPGFFSRTFFTCSSQGFVRCTGLFTGLSASIILLSNILKHHIFTSGFLGDVLSISNDTLTSLLQQELRIRLWLTSATIDPIPIATIDTYPSTDPICIAMESLILLLALDSRNSPRQLKEIYRYVIVSYYIDV